ncbi:MAG: hypothetical protein Ct9H300mP21_09080 [Pseudomonadota bacterium]|nr:MAG: hypothetical protein Ct9H300mP21_09080 [Pseudomonadota bacterium]
MLFSEVPLTAFANPTARITFSVQLVEHVLVFPPRLMIGIHFPFLKKSRPIPQGPQVYVRLQKQN